MVLLQCPQEEEALVSIPDPAGGFGDTGIQLIFICRSDDACHALHKYSNPSQRSCAVYVDWWSSTPHYQISIWDSTD